MPDNRSTQREKHHQFTQILEMMNTGRREIEITRL
uniref:Uncharacterized protein n=1 Tax=Megaselia scalaris TaxID=36166 RepID=T1GLT3_MEGSC